MTEYAIELNNLTKKFGDFTAVDDLSLHVKKGEIFGFLGPNGAGKSTTIRMLCTLAKPTSGSATIAGYDLIKDSIRCSRKYWSGCRKNDHVRLINCSRKPEILW